ncbi:morphinone reductase [Pseudomonas fluorescens]|uniref:Morphinone reductase n=1 Tax=Pseudomonas fluorescens TaxID=294 RepID=A0A379IB86_PSEFL|nr:morphinone reductase [Pseudomonas fluorescens]
MTTRLLSPLDIGPRTLQNRIILTPLIPSSPQPSPPCYVQCVGAGLVIAQGAPVCPEGLGHIDATGLYSAEQVAAWKAVTHTLHETGSLVVAQLWHVGRVSHCSLQPSNRAPLAPSGIRTRSKVFIRDDQGAGIWAPAASPREMTLADIRLAQQAFVDAAANAMTAGFDLVELHGASGYLIEQFLATGTNLRQDDYGGSLENRARFLLEIVDSLIATLGAERVGVRLSPWGSLNDIEDREPHAMALYLAEELNHRHIAYLHVVEWMPGTGPAYPEGFRRWLRAAFKNPLIVCANFDSEINERLLLEGLADAIALTTPLSLCAYGSKTIEVATWI